MTFCARCGEQIPENSDVCPLCGRESTIPVLQPAATLAATSSRAAQAAAWSPAPQGNNSAGPFYPELAGVRGWLLVFCVMTTILTPIGSFMVVRISRPSPWTLYNLALMVFALTVGVSVWTRSAHALTLVKAYLIALAALEIFRIAFVVVAHPPRGLALGMIGWIRLLAWVAVWGIYFHKSKRVRATFGRNL